MMCIGENNEAKLTSVVQIPIKVTCIVEPMYDYSNIFTVVVHRFHNPSKFNGYLYNSL